MVFSFLHYLLSFQRYSSFCITQIRCPMTSSVVLVWSQHTKSTISQQIIGQCNWRLLKAFQIRQNFFLLHMHFKAILGGPHLSKESGSGTLQAEGFLDKCFRKSVSPSWQTHCTHQIPAARVLTSISVAGIPCNFCGSTYESRQLRVSLDASSLLPKLSSCKNN